MALRPYENGTVDTAVYRGGPGSAQATYTDADVAGTIASAGAAGKGGGAIVLRADSSLIVDGEISANGQDGIGNTGGTADGDPDDNGDAGHQSFLCDHDGDNANPDPPNTPLIEVLNPVKDGPANPTARPCLPGGDPGGPYEHTGFIGAGGGAGGGVVLQARGIVTLGAVISAKGGDGGNGDLGNGGGGGGGVIKVLAPAQDGVDGAALAAEMAAGVSGRSTQRVFPGIAAPTDPIDEDGRTTTRATRTARPRRTNGLVVNDDRPTATLLPYGPFWWAGAGSATIPSRMTAAGSPGATRLFVCAARLAASAGPADACVLRTLIGGVTQPTAADPCGDAGQRVAAPRSARSAERHLHRCRDAARGCVGARHRPDDVGLLRPLHDRSARPHGRQQLLRSPVTRRAQRQRRLRRRAVHRSRVDRRRRRHGAVRSRCRRPPWGSASPSRR